jgi:hypothetical protein
MIEAFQTPSALTSNNKLSLRRISSPKQIGSMTTTTGLQGGKTSIPLAELTALGYDWCFNLGAPAALVAGAVVATLYENIRGGALDVRHDDTAYSSFAKKMTNILLLSAFGLQIMSIFVTTVTGTMLISQDFTVSAASIAKQNGGIQVTTALGFMRQHMEFEYLTARISFLQGLLNWLAGVAVEHTIPRKGQGKAGRQMDVFIASSLSLLLVLLLSFYNFHLTFYDNYWQMLHRWSFLFFQRHFDQFRPLSILYFPLTAVSFVTGIRAILPERRGTMEGN